ncbi:MAG: hypothetical protein IT168_11340 [Bryobacterales bacterium]|nr:hypothetical protein [Bryobacterales bacterium]
MSCVKRWSSMSGIACAMVFTYALAQQRAEQPKKDPEAGGVFRLPRQTEGEIKAEAPKPEEPKTAVLQNQGKPMRVAFQCTEDDITGFGMACTADDPCPVFVELAGLQPLGAKIFVTGNLHNGSTTMYSLLLASEDSGKTWTEPVERQKGVGLEHMQFYDFEVGWIAGESLGAMPRDPFFLLTTDGGKNWRKRPVFGESRISAIEQFYFESKTRGNLLIDRVQGSEAGGRYELYETMTGGDTWMVREVSSKPLQIKGAKPLGPPADWRLRSDSGAKAHYIEKKSGPRWEPVAAFAVDAGSCKPDATAIPEPPPVQETPAETSGPQVTPRRGPSQPPSLKK